jgi:hypothetical protein
MKGSTLSKIGGICSILVGVLYIPIGITTLLRPAEQRPPFNPDVFLTSFAQEPLFGTLLYWGFAISAVLAVAVVLAVSEKVRSLGEGWVRWMSTLAVIGFAVTALNYFRYLDYYPMLARAYATGDSLVKAVAASTQSTVSLDPDGWFIFGVVGLWFLVINLVALGGNPWPKVLSYLGIVGAIAYLLVMVGYVFGIYILTFSALVSVVIGPIWYIWVGLILRREAA